MSVMGRSVDADIDIAVRISYLQKAVASADRAVGYSNNNNNTDGASAVEHTPSMAAVETLLDLKDTLDVAGTIILYYYLNSLVTIHYYFRISTASIQ